MSQPERLHQITLWLRAGQRRDTAPRMRRMDWKQAIARWRSLPPQERQRRRWAAIPRNVARSMAFEGEPVSLEALEAEHARHPMPQVSAKPDAAA
jgi:hypothetical protein